MMSAPPEEEDGPLDPQHSLRQNPPSKKEGVYGGTWFPRQIARGPRCGAALHFRRNAAIGPLAFSLLDRSSGPFSFVPHCAQRSGDPF